RHIDRYRSGSRRLTAVAAHYGVPLSEEDAHGAAADALAAARVAWVIAQHTPKIAELTPAALHKTQAEAAAEQATSYADYLRKQGKPVDDVHLEWPLIPTRKEETCPPNRPQHSGWKTSTTSSPTSPQTKAASTTPVTGCSPKPSPTPPTPPPRTRTPDGRHHPA